MVALLLMLLGTFTRHEFTSAAGSRAYWLYVPGTYNGAKPVPLVVMLHGCTQDAADIARGTRLNEYAEKLGFLVIYPEQPAAHNPLKCWNWFEENHQSRDTGEPAIIAGITREAMEARHVDEKRIYLAGISAGAAMANIVAVLYPELYTAVGLHSGLEFKAATRALDARRVMEEGGPDPKRQGSIARRAMGEKARINPILIMNGSADESVPPLHAAQLGRQWLATFEALGLKAAGGTSREEYTTNGYTVSREVLRDASGRVVIQAVLIDRLGHAWAGGSTDGTYTDPKAPSATDEMLRFFGLLQ